MKVLLLISDLSAPGTGMQLAQLAQFLKREGCQVEVVSLKSGGAPGAWLETQGISPLCLNASSVLSSWRLLKLALILMRMRPDLLQTWNFHANIAGKALGFFCGAKLIVSAFRGPDSPARMELERVTSFLSSRIVLNSEWFASRLKLLAFGTSRFEVIGNSFERGFAEFKERKRPANGARWRLLFLGSRSFHSGIPALLHALRLLQGSGCDFEAELVGPSSPRFDAELELELAGLGLQNRVCVRPEIAHAEVPKLLEGFHLMVLPNVFNWTPNTLNEAFASGLPVVASDIEGVRELLKDGVTGLLAKPGDPVSLCDKLAKALEHYPQSVHMARQANKLLKERSQPESACRKYFDMYRGLLGGA